MGKSLVVVTTVLVLVGCAGPRLDQDAESRARHHIIIADTLQRAGEFPKAVLEYRLITEMYPKTSYYPVAVRNLAILHARPGTPIANDSIALFWLNAYRQLPLPPAERQTIDLLQTLMAKLRSVRAELALETLVADSLAFIARKHGTELTANARRIQELEQQLQQASSELTKMKEVDIRMSRSRQKK